MKSLNSKFIVLQREQQICLLEKYLGDNEDQTLPALFAFGLPATGKSLILKYTITKLKHRLVCVDCVEYYSPRLIFEHILCQLCPESFQCCVNANTFIHSLKEFAPKDASIYILFERAERLRDMGPNLLPMLLKLQQLAEFNVGVVLESGLAWEKFREGTGVLEPIVVHFPEYNKENLLEIMLLDCPSGFPEHSYRNFVKLLLDVFLLTCKDLNDLRALASSNFPVYIEPIKSGEAKPEDSMKLWRHMEGHLKLASPANKYVLEMPVFSKYLLIAAYIASHNPVKLDKRLFVKLSSKKKKSAKELIKKDPRKNSHIVGPKFFDLERHVAIFYSILEERIAHTASIYSQISSLVSLGLLAASQDASLENRKFKCLASLPLVIQVSKSVGFEIMKYLYDFL